MTELYRTVVVDHEYKQLGTVVKNYCHMLDSIIAEYQACLSNLTAGAVESGETQKALLEFLSYVYKLKGKLVEIGDKFYGCCNDFINEIIGGGQYLYDNRYSDTAIRDFTQYRYNELVKGIDCNHESSNPLIRLLDHLDDKVIGFAIKWLGKYDIKHELETSVKDVQLKLLDYNNDSKKFLKGVFEDVLNIDREYGETIQGATGTYQNKKETCAGTTSAALSDIGNILWKLSTIINPEHGVWTAEELDTEMALLYEKLAYYVNTALSYHTSMDEISDESIKEFCKIDFNGNFYLSYTGPIREVISDIDLGGTASIIFFHGQTITLDSVKKYFFIPNDVALQDQYAYLITKKQMAETVNKITNTELSISCEEDVRKAQEIISAIRNNKKSYPGYEKYKKMYDELDDKLKGISKKMGRTMDTSEIILKVFTNYSKNIKIVESLSKNMSPDSLSYIALRELKNEYDHKYLACCKDILEYAYSEVADEVIDGIEKEFIKKVVEKFGGDAAAKGAGGLLSIAQTAIDVVGDLTGLSMSSQAQSDLCILNSQTSELQNVYMDYFQKIKGGNLTKENIQGLKDSFEMLKGHIGKEYELAEQIADAKGDYDLKSYYQYCKRTVSKANIAHPELPELMSFEEYNKSIKW